MDDNEKNPPQEKRPSPAGQKLHLDLSEAMSTSIDDDDDIIELKDEVTLPPKEKEPKVELNEHLPPASSMNKPSEETHIDFDAFATEYAESENRIHGADDLSFEEEDAEDVEAPSPAAEPPLKTEGANEVMEITEFDDIVSENDNEMITLIDDHKESEPEEEFLELIEVEEDSLAEAADEKIEEEIIQFDDPQEDVEDVELENFINDSLNEEIQIGDELEDDLINSLGVEAGPEMSLTDQQSETEEFNFNMDTHKISEKIDQLDDIFFDDTQAETEYDDETASLTEDSHSESDNRDIHVTELDALEPPPPDIATSAWPAGPDQIEQSIEQFIEQNYSGKIESMISAIIEKAVAKEIDRLKSVLLEDDDSIEEI